MTKIFGIKPKKIQRKPHQENHLSNYNKTSNNPD